MATSNERSVEKSIQNTKDYTKKCLIGVVLWNALWVGSLILEEEVTDLIKPQMFCTQLRAMCNVKCKDTMLIKLWTHLCVSGEGRKPCAVKSWLCSLSMISYILYLHRCILEILKKKKSCKINEIKDNQNKSC